MSKANEHLTWTALTAKEIEFPGDRKWLALGHGTGVAVKSGGKYWVHKFRWGGVPDEVQLGSVKKVSIPEAKTLTAWCLAEFNAGRNPRETRSAAKLERKREAEAPKVGTVGELAKEFVTVINKRLKDERSREIWVRRLQRKSIGRIADMEPGDVTLADVKPMLEAYYARAPKAADSTRFALAKLLTWAHGTDRIRTPGWSNPAAWSVLSIKLEEQGQEHETEHHPALAHTELGLFLSQMWAMESHDVAVRAAFEWDIISASRITEAVLADWSEINWEADCWVIPAKRSKMRRIHRVPLTDRHHALLEMMMPPGATEAPKSGPIFPGRAWSKNTRRGDSVSASGVRALMRLVRKPDGSPFVAVKANPADPDERITLHGFRTAFRAWAEGEVYPVKLPTGETRRVEIYSDVLIELSLAHKVGGEVRNAYVGKGGDTLEKRRDIMDAWAKFAQVVRTPAEVVSLPRRPRVAAVA